MLLDTVLLVRSDICHCASAITLWSSVHEDPAPRTQYQPIAGKVWCTASHVLNAPTPTLAKQVGP